jgi:hypothetical protein
MAVSSSQQAATASLRSSRDSVFAQMLLATDKPVYYRMDAFSAGTIPRVLFFWTMEYGM